MSTCDQACGIGAHVGSHILRPWCVRLAASDADDVVVEAGHIDEARQGRYCADHRVVHRQDLLSRSVHVIES